MHVNSVVHIHETRIHIQATKLTGNGECSVVRVWIEFDSNDFIDNRAARC
jgi:hypothetical protein